MKNLEIGDSAQVHAAFLVYMDLAEGEFDKIVENFSSSHHVFVCLFV